MVGIVSNFLPSSRVHSTTGGDENQTTFLKNGMMKKEDGPVRLKKKSWGRRGGGRERTGSTTLTQSWAYYLQQTYLVIIKITLSKLPMKCLLTSPFGTMSTMKYVITTWADPLRINIGPTTNLLNIKAPQQQCSRDLGRWGWRCGEGLTTNLHSPPLLTTPTYLSNQSISNKRLLKAPNRLCYSIRKIGRW